MSAGCATAPIRYAKNSACAQGLSALLAIVLTAQCKPAASPGAPWAATFDRSPVICMDSFSFSTIRFPAEAVYKVLGSRFLSFALPVSSVEEVKAVLEKYKKEYFDATHVCYAYRLGATGGIWKAHDAGEPAHSAGDPILGQLRSKNVSYTLLIVVRYFGGTKLGVGGLISAYKMAAELVLKNCQIVQRELTFEAKLFFEYPQMAAVLRLQHEMGAEMIDRVFETSCTVRWRMGLAKLSLFKEKIKNISVQTDIGYD